MINHPIKKLAGLTILYICIILGIFFLQFRSDSIISKTFGLLHIILTETSNEYNTPTLKNSFLVSFGGITLFSDPTAQVILKTDNNETPAVLDSWEEISKNAIKLSFTDGSIVTFTSADNSSGLPVEINTELADNTTSLSIPYKTNGTYTMTNRSETGALIESSSGLFSFSTHGLSEKMLVFTKENQLSLYDIYTEKKFFNYSDIIDFVLAKQPAYDSTIKQLQASIITTFENAPADSISENSVSAYIAQMALEGKYATALTNIPSTFLTSNKRTYFSSPFLDNLVKMDKSLKMKYDTLQFRMEYSLKNKMPDVFVIDGFSSFLQTKLPNQISEILTLPEQSKEELTLNEAASILNVYYDLSKINNSSAEILQSATKKAFDVIFKASQVKDNLLVLNTPNGQADVILTVKAGYGLLQYGINNNDKSIQAAGILLINSALRDIANFDLETLATVYAELLSGNTFYPHVQYINIPNYNNTSPIWAWTCAKQVSISQDSNGVVNISTTFPKNETHYMFLNGIEPFSSIEIYGILFRTDPRFETYNSSGYVYNADTKTLLLKYKHKTETELVRLFPNKPEPPKPVPVPSTTIKTTPETASPTPAVSIPPSTAPTTSTTVPTTPAPATEESSTPPQRRKPTQVPTPPVIIPPSVN